MTFSETKQQTAYDGKAITLFSIEIKIVRPWRNSPTGDFRAVFSILENLLRQ